MKKIICKGIIGVFIFTFAFLTLWASTIKTVNAQTCDEKKQDLKKDSKLSTRYGYSVDYSNKKIVIQMKKNANNNNLKFKIVKIGFYSEGTLNGTTNDDYHNLQVNPEYQSEIEFGSVITKEDTGNGNINITKMVFIGDPITDETTIKNMLGINSLVIKPGTTISKNKKEIYNGVNSEYGFYVTIEPVDYTKITVIDKCPKFNFQLTEGVITEDYIDLPPKMYYPSDFNITINPIPDEITYADFDEYCAKNPDVSKTDSFAYRFCSDRASAKNANVKRIDVKSDKDTTFTGDNAFKCDPKKVVSNDKIPEGSNYYVNRDYLWGVKEESHTATYTYHSNFGNQPDGTYKQTATCTSTCEEIVTVEYGPPVAVISGLCFEYKIKVTSRVNCISSLKDKGKDFEMKPAVVCTPTPSCKHKNGNVTFSAGPNQEFDNCVVSCDGGKYSDKCVNKCYKEVYGTSIKKTNGNELVYANKLNYNDESNVSVEKVKDSEKKAEDDYYTYVIDKNGTIKWKVLDLNRNITKGRYGGKGTGGEVLDTDSYFHKNIDRWGFSYYIYPTYQQSTGIPSKANCNGNCYWSKNSSELCKQNDEYPIYLNDPAVYNTATRKSLGLSTTSPIEDDLKANAKIYDQIVDDCTSKTKCSTTQAEFTINVKYSKLTKKGDKYVEGKDSLVETKFPYETKPATIQPVKNSDGVTCSDAKDEWKSILISYDYCYNCSKQKSTNEYMTEWGFPGYWQRIKGDKVDIKYSGGDKNYKKSSKKEYCLPRGSEDVIIKDVNVNWWNWYMGQKYGSDNSYSQTKTNKNSIVCYDGKKLENPCYIGKDTKSLSVKDIKWYDNSAEGWNIWGDTKNFGEFDWNIEVRCFYAKNENDSKKDPNKDKNKDCVDQCKNGTSDHEVRAGDSQNLFPNESGNKPTSPSTTARTPGWNWTNYAKMDNAELKAKNGKYTQYAIESDPEALIEWIQSQGSSIYSSKNVDYAVYITKADINKLRKDNYTKQWSDWSNYTNQGEDYYEKGVYHYQSPLFRGSNKLSNAVYPSGDAIYCNNIDEHNATAGYSAKCQVIKKEGK